MTPAMAMIDWLQLNFVALLNVIVIDVVLAGDNAIIVGLAASRVAPELRARVIFWGIVGAVVLRVAFAALATQLLAIVGLTLAGGLLLLWVCWKMYWELTHSGAEAGRRAWRGTAAAASRRPPHELPRRRDPDRRRRRVDVARQRAGGRRRRQGLARRCWSSASASPSC